MEVKLNYYAKKFLMLIQRDYENSLSDSQKNMLSDLMTKNFIVVHEQCTKEIYDSFMNTSISTGEFSLDIPLVQESSDGLIHLYPFRLERMNESEKIAHLTTEVLPIYIFRYLIRCNEVANIPEKDKEFATFLRDGLVAKYARELCINNQLQIPNNREYIASETFVTSIVFDNVPKPTQDILTFQNSYGQIATAVETIHHQNIVDIYQKRYIHQNNMEQIRTLLNQKLAYLNPSIAQDQTKLMEKIKNAGTKEYAVECLKEYIAEFYPNKNNEEYTNLLSDIFDAVGLNDKMPDDSSLVRKGANGYNEALMIIGSCFLLGTLIALLFIR